SEKQQRDGQRHGPSDFLIGRSKRNAEKYKLWDTEDDDDNMKLTRAACIRYSPDSYRHHDVTKRCHPLVQRALFYLTLKTSLSDSIKDLIQAFGDVLLIRRTEEEAAAEEEAITIISLYDIIYGIGYLPSLPSMPSAAPAIPPLSKFLRLLDHLAFDHTLGDHHQHDGVAHHPATPPSPKGGSPEVPLRCLWLKDALEVVLNPQSVLRGGDDPLIRHDIHLSRLRRPHIPSVLLPHPC
ncbi:hypothetical protein FOZ63_010916, partial [Perkinsus olseni]